MSIWLDSTPTLSPADEDRDKLIRRFSDLYRSYVTATLSGTETGLGRVVKQSHLPDHTTVG